MTSNPSTTIGSNATTTSKKEGEFGTWSIATDIILCSPVTKSGKALFYKSSKSDVKSDDRLEGKSSEGETFRILIREL